VNKRRRWIALGVVLFAVAWRTMPLFRQLRAEDFSRVTRGMTQIEVEWALGCPPGNYGRHPQNGFLTCEGVIFPGVGMATTESMRIWTDDTTRFEVYFDGNGRVIGSRQKSHYQQVSDGSGFFGWLLRQFSL